MPQLMPLVWLFSIFMVFLLVFVMIMVYNDLNFFKSFFSEDINVFVKKNYLW